MKLLIKFVIKHKTELFFLVLFSVAAVCFQVWYTGITADVTNQTVKALGGEITEHAMKAAVGDLIVKAIIIVIGTTAATIFCGFFAGRIAVCVSEKIREMLYEKTLTFSLKEMNEFTVPSMINRCSNDVLQVRDGVYLFLTTALPVPFLIVGGLYGVLRFKFSMTWIVLLGAVLVTCLFYVVVKKSMPLFARMAGELDSLNRVTREGLSGIQILRALNRETWNRDRIRDNSAALRKTAEITGFLELLLQPGMYLILNLLNLVVIWLGGKYAAEGTMQVGDITAFINYLYMVVNGLSMAAIVGIQMPNVMISMDRIGDVLVKESAIKDGGISEAPDSYDVEFDNVCFRYSDEAGMVVRNISFTAKQGEMTVIVGNTGCGKTTLMQLIPRLYDSSEGTVRIGGVDVRDMKLETLRSLIGYVPQRAFLYKGDIRSNIAFRDPLTSDSDVEQAAEVSQSMPFILAKEKGFSEWITSGGSNVSGGQRQRLTIARALTGSPKILILDDSASALDLETGLKLRDAIRSLIGDITVIFVTQRLSFLRNADRIVVMQDGEIRAVGTHDELKDSCDFYRDILQSQMGA